MSIVKNTPHILKHSGLSFTTLINNTLDCIKNPGTLGIYVYLASKPSDWEISESNLQSRFNKGRDYIRARMAELKLLGLLKSTAIKNKQGRIIRWETVLLNEVQITENPSCGVQITEKPPSGQPSTLENPPTTNKRSIQIKETNKPPISPKGGLSVKKVIPLTVIEMLNDNPACIPQSLIEEWISYRKKPISERVWNKTSKVLMQLLNDGIQPQVAFERMLEKQWEGLEYRYFYEDIKFSHQLALPPKKKQPSYDDNDISWKNQEAL